LSRDLLLIGLSVFTWGLGENIFFSFQSLYLEKLGAHPVLIGIMLGVYGFSGLLAHLPAGYFADRFGRRPILIAGWICGLTSTIIMGLAITLPLFVIGFLAYALTTFVIAPLNSYITAARGTWSVARALTIISSAYSLGAIIGPLIGGKVAEDYGYRPLFFIAAIIFLFSNLIVTRIHPQPVEHHLHDSKGIGLFSNLAFLGFLGLIFLSTFAMYLPQPLTPNFLQNEKAISLIQIGRLFSINAIGIVFLNLILGQFEARLGFIVSQVAVLIFSFILLRGSGIPFYVFAFFLLGGYRSARALSIAHVSSLVDRAKIGFAYGLAETCAAMATVLSPLLAGYLYTRSPALMFAWSSIAILGTILASGIGFIVEALGKNQKFNRCKQRN
jgi:MFS family permease